jgi:hypothetical protein
MGDTVEITIWAKFTVNILANDDFLVSDGNSITQTGSGSRYSSFDPITGLMSYTPLASEAGSTV